MQQNSFDREKFMIGEVIEVPLLLQIPSILKNVAAFTLKPKSTTHHSRDVIIILVDLIK